MLYRKDMMENTKLEDLIISNNKLIYHIISKYQNYYEIEDLYQAAVIGIIKASKNYCDNTNTKFTTYAYSYILGEVIKYVNDNKKIKMSSEYLKLSKKINEARTILTQTLMKAPSNIELAIFLEIDEKMIDYIDMLNLQMDSLDRIISEDGKNLLLLDTIKDKKSDNSIDTILLYQEISKLDKVEQQLLKERYFYDKTQKETANSLGMNQVQVSRNEKKILQKLKNNLCRIA